MRPWRIAVASKLWFKDSEASTLGIPTAENQTGQKYDVRNHDETSPSFSSTCYRKPLDVEEAVRRGQANPHRSKKKNPIEINNRVPTPVSPYLHVAERQRLPRSLAKKFQKSFGRTAHAHEAKACVSRPITDTELFFFNKMPD